MMMIITMVTTIHVDGDAESNVEVRCDHFQFEFPKKSPLMVNSVGAIHKLSQ